MEHRKGRYVKLNIVDWLLIAAAALLLLALLVRGVGGLLAPQRERCRAEVSFVIRELREEDAARLSAAQDPFYFSDGALLTAAPTIHVQRATTLVRDEDGNLRETESLLTYKATVSFTAEGYLANDGTFLLGGTRRLSTGESLTLTCCDVTYKADVTKVHPQKTD